MIFDRGGFCLQKTCRQSDLVGVGGFSWSFEFRVGSEGLEGLGEG